MSEPTIWPLEDHTKAKHEILRNYLAAWFPILSRYSQRIVYIDGFAGPGVYSGGEPGSPVLAIKTAYEHLLKDRFKEIVFFFIEKREDRAVSLKEALKNNFPDLPNDQIKYSVVSGEFETTVSSLLESLEKSGTNLAPTFAFIDPFGYTGFSMDLLEKIMSYPKCEIFITFMTGFIRRFLDNEKEDALTKLFRTDEWKKIREVSGLRDQPLLDLYIKQLKHCCDVKYVNSFKMINKFNQPLYHLVFCTNSLKGLEVMKNAMWRVDRTGDYKFSDRWDEKQTYLFDFHDEVYWIPKAAALIGSKFKGQRVSVKDVSDYIIGETPFLFKKSILQYVEDNYPKAISEVVVPNRKRKKRSFPDDCIIVFN